MITRTGVDRCPGVLSAFSSGDGALVRLRVPGGRIASATLSSVMDLAVRHGAPVVQLTSRGNLQLRALPEVVPDELVEAVSALGLLPSPTHERARTILADPVGQDVGRTVHELDAAICADPALADLPGRFLWAVAGPPAAGGIPRPGSILAEQWDLAVQPLDADRALVLVGSRALRVARDLAVPTAVARARTFLETRAGDTTWNVRDLPGDSAVFAGTVPWVAPTVPPLRPGPLGRDLVVAAPLGMLRPEHTAALTQAADELVLTPWRSVVVRDGASCAGQLAAAGLVTQPGSAWARVSACVGAPACRRTAIPTLELAAAAAAQLPPDGPVVHVVGCDRRCGEPACDHVGLVAPQDLSAVLAAAGGIGA